MLAAVRVFSRYDVRGRGVKRCLSHVPRKEILKRGGESTCHPTRSLVGGKSILCRKRFLVGDEVFRFFIGTDSEALKSKRINERLLRVVE